MPKVSMVAVADSSTVRTDPEKASALLASRKKMLRGLTRSSFQYEETEEVTGVESFSSRPVREAQTVCLSVILQHGRVLLRACVWQPR